MSKTVTHQDLRSLFGSEDLLEKAQNASFAGLIFELLSGKAPAENELKIFELILNLSIDHGPDTPSAIKVIEEAKKGESLSEAVAEGVEEINDQHGGAGEQLMELLYKIRNNTPASRTKFKIQNLVAEYVKEGKKLPGFGHRIYKDMDPRAELIFDKLSILGMGEEYIKAARKIQVEFEEQTGKHLPINIDGAIACALCSFGWEPKLGVAVFLIARTPGLAAHYLNNSYDYARDKKTHLEGGRMDSFQVSVDKN